MYTIQAKPLRRRSRNPGRPADPTPAGALIKILVAWDCYVDNGNQWREPYARPERAAMFRDLVLEFGPDERAAIVRGVPEIEKSPRGRHWSRFRLGCLSVWPRLSEVERWHLRGMRGQPRPVDPSRLTKEERSADWYDAGSLDSISRKYARNRLTKRDMRAMAEMNRLVRRFPVMGMVLIHVRGEERLRLVPRHYIPNAA